jgi:hypothetical protein
VCSWGKWVENQLKDGFQQNPGNSGKALLPREEHRKKKLNQQAQRVLK